MPDLTVIYNPLAGTANLGSIMDRISSFWENRGWRVKVSATEYSGHARTLALEAASSNQDMVLAAGGDGTLGEIAGGLAFSDTIMAPFPAGTGNSFAKELSVPRLGRIYRSGVIAACEALADGKVQLTDIGRCGPEQFWLQWVGAGMDGYVVQHIEPRSRIIRRLGRIGYIGEGLPILTRFPGMNASVKIDDREIKGDFLMITLSNCRLYGGGHIVLSPNAHLDDGQMEIWLFKGSGRRRIFHHIVSIARHRHYDSPHIDFFMARSISVDTKPELPFHRDGDPAGLTPFKAWIEPQALRLLVPTTAPNGLFQNTGIPLSQAL